MDEELTAEERERMRKMAALARVSAGIVRKWTWLFAMVFAVLFAGFSWYVVQRSAKSSWRYTATTRLLYMPLQNAKVPAMGDKQLFRVLDRHSLKRRVGEELPLPAGEKAMLGADLKIVQERQPSNLFTLTAKSGSAEAAVRKVNFYAAILIGEYGEWRVNELNRWNGDATERRTKMRAEVAKIEEELVDLRTRAGTDSPVEAQTALTTMIGEQRRNLLMLDVEIEAAEKTRESLEGADGSLTAALIQRAPELRKLKTAIEELDDEIAKLRQVYTDLNPRVLGKLEDRDAMEKRYREIVAECGGEDPGEDRIRELEKDQTSILNVASKLDALKEAKKSLAETLSRNEERVQELMRLTPQVSLLSVRRRDLNYALVDLDEQISNAAHMLENASSELQQLERAEGTGERSPYRRENFAIAAAGAAVGTAALGLLTVGLGLLFGRVRGARELALAGDIRVLGSLPGRWTMRRRAAQNAMRVVALHFVDAPESQGTVAVCRLKGARLQPRFVEALEWSISMAGRRQFSLRVVPAETFDAPDGAKTMLGVVRKDNEGWFPASNPYALAPAELEVLRADLTELRKEFDCIVVTVHDGLRKGGDFSRQLLGVCDAALVVAGANRTKRKDLAYVLRLAQEAGKPLMGLVTGARGGIVRREQEESQW